MNGSAQLRSDQQGRTFLTGEGSVKRVGVTMVVFLSFWKFMSNYL